MKQKKCRICGAMFVPRRPLQPVCEDMRCKCEYALLVADKAKTKREKVEKANDRQKREQLKSRRDHQREAQAAVNAFVRARDDGMPCISCGRHHDGQWHAGHYLSRGAHPELALDERNIHRQCQPCNTHLSGNQLEYRKGLISRYGQEYVDWLEGPHESMKPTIDDLKQIKSHYIKKLKELRG